MTSVTKPSTRSSIRHSLNLASVGKALADVMNKEGRDASSKNAKDISSRRLSTINLTQGTAASRTSLGGDTKPPLQKRGGTPDSKTITRKTRRASEAPIPSPATKSVNKDSAVPVNSPGTGQNIITRASARRTRNLLPSSALPKYRPKSAVIDAGKKTPSPVLVGTRRRHSGSDDEKEGDNVESNNQKATPHSHEKLPRPMSPLPRRLNFKVAAVSITTTSVPKRNGSASPSSKISPPRPMKSIKTATAASVAASCIPRPPSAGSSVSSMRTPTTPKTPNFKNPVEAAHSDRHKNSQGSQCSTPLRVPPESPLARHSRRPSAHTANTNQRTIANMSHISEGNSDDSDVDDVEMLLAPVASLAAPTPAMPRMELASHRQRADPQTPTRSSSYLPTRANLSYLSPLPPDADDSSPSRRPRQPGSDYKGRGSILSWEQLATEASRTLGEDEIDSMLADIPAPFHSGAVSPSPRSSHLEESPCLGVLHSPGGYGSISQILLPDVTPSPAVNHNARFDHMAAETSAADAAAVTFLRLQLASVENTAKDRLRRLQAMEEEIHDLKAARLRDAEELGKQVSFLEERLDERLHSDRDLKERIDEERSAYIASLEDRLKQEQAFREQAVEGAVAKTRMALEEAALRSNSRKLEVACAARGAGAEWASVRDLAESELDLVRGNREMLSIVLAGLDQSQRQLCRATA